MEYKHHLPVPYLMDMVINLDAAIRREINERASDEIDTDLLQPSTSKTMEEILRLVEYRRCTLYEISIKRIMKEVVLGIMKGRDKGYLSIKTQPLFDEKVGLSSDELALLVEKI